MAYSQIYGSINTTGTITFYSLCNILTCELKRLESGNKKMTTGLVNAKREIESKLI